MSKQLNRDAIQEASAAVEAAEERLSLLRDRIADLGSRKQAASQATNFAAAAHRSALADRELGDSPASEADLVALREARRDAIHIEEGLAGAAQEISARIQAADHDLLACKRVLLEGRIRHRCSIAQDFINRALGRDAESASYVASLRALAAEVNEDRAALQQLEGTRVFLPDFYSLGISQLPGDWHGSVVERGGVTLCLLAWRGMFSGHHEGPESGRLDMSGDFPLSYPKLPPAE